MRRVLYRQWTLADRPSALACSMFVLSDPETKQCRLNGARHHYQRRAPGTRSCPHTPAPFFPHSHRANDVIVQLDGMDASTATQVQVVNYIRPLLRSKMVFGVVQVRSMCHLAPLVAANPLNLLPPSFFPFSLLLPPVLSPCKMQMSAEQLKQFRQRLRVLIRRMAMMRQRQMMMNRMAFLGPMSMMDMQLMAAGQSAFNPLHAAGATPGSTSVMAALAFNRGLGPAGETADELHSRPVAGSLYDQQAMDGVTLRPKKEAWPTKGRLSRRNLLGMSLMDDGSAVDDDQGDAAQAVGVNGDSKAAVRQRPLSVPDMSSSGGYPTFGSDGNAGYINTNGGLSAPPGTKLTSKVLKTTPAAKTGSKVGEYILWREERRRLSGVCTRLCTRQ